jgi:Zn-dependent protease
MANSQQGSLRLFRFAGIDVFVHWSWLIVAWFELANRKNEYQNPVWNVVEYLTLFGIVTLHEFGHALACRSVGGLANRIMLWPLGGIAFVQPPPRPGALLWSIAAGPLVNVALLPVTIGAYLAAANAGLDQTYPDTFRYLYTITWQINAGLLIFNMLPIYPLDGGQMLQAILWFVIGRAWSLLVASTIGLVVGALLVVAGLLSGEWWIAILSLFIASRGWLGFRQGLALGRLMRTPRHAGFACPACGLSPPVGEYWTCGGCRTRFDTFARQGVCPGCGGHFAETQCVHCHARNPLTAWAAKGSGSAAPRVIDAALANDDSANPYASPRDVGQ